MQSYPNLTVFRTRTSTFSSILSNALTMVERGELIKMSEANYVSYLSQTSSWCNCSMMEGEKSIFEGIWNCTYSTDFWGDHLNLYMKNAAITVRGYASKLSGWLNQNRRLSFFEKKMICSEASSRVKTSCTSCMRPGNLIVCVKPELSNFLTFSLNKSLFFRSDHSHVWVVNPERWSSSSCSRLSKLMTQWDPLAIKKFALSGRTISGPPQLMVSDTWNTSLGYLKGLWGLKGAPVASLTRKCGALSWRLSSIL